MACLIGHGFRHLNHVALPPACHGMGDVSSRKASDASAVQQAWWFWWFSCCCKKEDVYRCSLSAGNVVVVIFARGESIVASAQVNRYNCLSLCNRDLSTLQNTGHFLPPRFLQLNKGIRKLLPPRLFFEATTLHTPWPVNKAYSSNQ